VGKVAKKKKKKKRPSMVQGAYLFPIESLEKFRMDDDEHDEPLVSRMHTAPQTETQ